MTNDDTCSTCDAIEYYRAFAKWSRESSRMWEAWEIADPDSEYDEPPAYEELWKRRPRTTRQWLIGSTDYDAADLIAATRWLQCGRPDCTTSKASILEFPKGGTR